MSAELEPILRENLLVLARAFAKARDVKLITVGRLAHGDPPFFERLEKLEGSFTVRKYDEVVSWFDKNWPEDAERPSIIVSVQKIFTTPARRRT
jgi:hypothetical protein